MCDIALLCCSFILLFLVIELRLVSGFWLWQILSNIFNLSYLLLHTKVWSQQLSPISHLWVAQSWILEHTHIAKLKSSVLIHRNCCVQKTFPCVMRVNEKLKPWFSLYRAKSTKQEYSSFCFFSLSLAKIINFRRIQSTKITMNSL